MFCAADIYGLLVRPCVFIFVVGARFCLCCMVCFVINCQWRYLKNIGEWALHGIYPILVIHADGGGGGGLKIAKNLGVLLLIIFGFSLGVLIWGTFGWFLRITFGCLGGVLQLYGRDVY